ncbi:MAG: hypothetical protein KAJ42_10330 [Gemmatimonadetes bacterium]|nr:hypothetical protein [Gemmatimonadota bacterium]
MSEPRFYTTNVSPEQSLGEIQALLRKYGARRFGTEWSEEGVASVHFNLPVPEAEGMMNVVLRPKLDAVRKKMAYTPTGRHRGSANNAQVERVAWRQMKAILEGMLLAADTGMFSAGQVFMGMAETDDGEPLWDVVVSQGIAGLLAPVADYEVIE